MKKSNVDPKLTEERLAIIDRIEKIFLFDGYQARFRNLVPTDESFPYVMGHNDHRRTMFLSRKARTSSSS